MRARFGARHRSGMAACQPMRCGWSIQRGSGATYKCEHRKTKYKRALGTLTRKTASCTTVAATAHAVTNSGSISSSRAAAAAAHSTRTVQLTDKLCISSVGRCASFTMRRHTSRSALASTHRLMCLRMRRRASERVNYRSCECDERVLHAREGRRSGAAALGIRRAGGRVAIGRISDWRKSAAQLSVRKRPPSDWVRTGLH